MRQMSRLSVLGLAAGLVLGACKPDAVIESPTIPTAGVRFINAVPDTGGAFGIDMRFTDLVENSSHFRVTYRNLPTSSGGVTASTGIQFKPAQAGNRRFAIFLNDTIASIASTKLRDTTISLTAGKNYTVILMGTARGNGLRLRVIEENITDPASNVALRVINTTPDPLDVSQYAATGTAPATPTWANVAGYSVSSFVTAPPGQIRYSVRPAGGATTLFADPLALVGTPASSTAGAGAKLDIPPLPGTTVAGSAVTLIIFPPSVAGARVPTFATAGGSFMWDKRPPACPAGSQCTYSNY